MNEQKNLKGFTQLGRSFFRNHCQVWMKEMKSGMRKSFGMVTIPDELLSLDFNLDAIRSDLMKLVDSLHYNVTLEN